MLKFYVKMIFFIQTIVLMFHLSSSDSKVIFTWDCNKNTNSCNKKLADKSSNENVQSYKVCNLLCGQSSIIWPEPVNSEINGPPIYINKIIFEDNLHTKSSKSPSRSTQSLLTDAINVFMGRIKKENTTHSKTMANSNVLKVVINIKDTQLVQLTLQTNESYQISAPKISTEPNMVKILIKGETFYGVRHGLETLSQLIVYDNVNGGLVIPKSIEITDYPKYPYRGLMLDTSRNYFSVESIRRTIDAMSMNKFNRFHWHLTDTHSFPLKLEKYKLFAEYGAYSPEKVYTEEDIKYLVEYAKVRGIRIIPELDAPAHCGEGWQAVPGSQVCFDKEPFSKFCPEPPCGQLNPLNKEVYDTLGGLYAELLRIFQTDIFHMGGDEVSLSCWKTSEEIENWINSKGDENAAYYELWNAFQKKAFNKLMRAQRNLSVPEPEVILWTSRLTDKQNLNVLKPNKYIIQVWDNVLEDTKVLRDLLEYDFRIILSNVNPLYLDCGHGSWVSGGADWCSPYKTWQSIYHNSIPEMLKIPEDKKHLILGQEAALWTESAGEESLDIRLWPRVSALAERTWSNPSTIWKDAENRMLYHRNRLISLGINADAIEPEWCAINKGGCGHADPSLLIMPNEVMSFPNPSIMLLFVFLTALMVLTAGIHLYRKIICNRIYAIVSRRKNFQKL